MNTNIEKTLEETKPKRKILLNGLRAFLFGGLICLISQIIMWLIGKIDGVTSEEASTISVIIVVFIASLLTGFNVYDRIGQIAGCGSIIPITGFANSMTSAAMESKSEGIILGIIPNMFKLAGSVIVVGVVGSFIVGTIRYIFGF